MHSIARRPRRRGYQDRAARAAATTPATGARRGTARATERVATYFLSCNRGKKSAAIDFAQQEGAALVRNLAEPGRRGGREFQGRRPAKFGLDAESLRARNPRLIVASITGFGQDGPYADRAGYDFIIQGMGGLMSITGLPDGEPGGGPMRVGVAVADLFTGMYTTVAILAALYRREKTGEGAHIDMALFDTQLAVLANQAAGALISGKDPPRQGNTHPSIVPYQPFDAADQPIIIAVGNDRQFARLAEICGHPEWAGDERFASNGARVANRAEIVRLIGDAIRHKPAARMARAARSRGHSGWTDQHASPRPSRTSRRNTVRWCGRSPERRWPGRRSGSTGLAPTPTSLRPRLASIPTRCSRPLAWTASALAPCGRKM